jgi:transcription initiation factor TFIIF subunit alpha
MNHPPAAVNGVVRKKTAADGLFKPTNNQKKRFPLGAPSKALVRPPPPPSANSGPDLKSVNTFHDPRAQSAGTGQTAPQQNLPVKEYKLVTSKRELLEGLRYHLLQLDDKLTVDIRNEEEFPKPAHLHRRNPDWKTPAKDGGEPKEADAETEAMAKRREARQKEREANLAQIAPSAASNRRKLFSTKKTAQVYHNDYTEEEKRRIQMNYEEKLPWVLEDYDSKHTLVGKHNQGSMGVYAAFAYEPSADGVTSRFRLVPVEKSYRFDRPSNLQEDIDFDTLEKAYKTKRIVEPEILIRKREDRRAEIEREREAKESRGLFVFDRGLANTREGEDADLDFEDDFADDEEGDMFGDKDEDEKAAEKKVKEDHLKANIGWQEKDETEVEAAEKKELELERLKGIWSSDMRSKLEKRERNYNLGSDSDDSSVR